MSEHHGLTIADLHELGTHTAAFPRLGPGTQPEASNKSRKRATWVTRKCQLMGSEFKTSLNVFCECLFGFYLVFSVDSLAVVTGFLAVKRGSSPSQRVIHTHMEL